jgi:hypothetical protein
MGNIGPQAAHYEVLAADEHLSAQWTLPDPDPAPLPTPEPGPVPDPGGPSPEPVPTPPSEPAA